MYLQALADFCSSRGMLLTDDQLSAFDRYRVRLYELNAFMNLTRVLPEDCETRHFIDSLLPVDLIATGASVLDVGTGPGLPAWPLACARPDLRVTALDGSNKGLVFLREMALPNLEVVQARAEDWDRRERFDVVTGRALAPLPIQLEVSAPWVRIGGLLIPFRTPSEAPSFEGRHLRELGLELAGVEERPIPGTDVMRAFPVYLKTKRTPDVYPRLWGKMRQNPLG